MANRVAILGAGPAGLAAAHAAYLAGNWVHIFSRGEQSRLYGCQYLHAPLPEIRVEQRDVKYELRGTAESYREKVYGDAWKGKVSPSDLEGSHTAWDLRKAYNDLWHLYVAERHGRSKFSVVDINPAWIEEWLTHPETAQFDHIISTVPARLLCADYFGNHSFFGEDIWAVGDAAELGQVAPVTTPPETIICNGEDAPSWYRVSNVFGATTVEWPGRTKPPIPYAVRVTKPLHTDCDCYPNIVRMGRYGAWKKDQLTHHVFRQTLELLSADSSEVPISLRSDHHRNSG